MGGECDAVVKSGPDIPDFCWTLDDFLAIFVDFRPTSRRVTKRPWEGVARGRRTSIAASTGEAALAAIDVLMLFHSSTTTDSVQSISGGLAESPSEVFSPPSSSLKAQVAACSRDDASHGRLVTSTTDRRCRWLGASHPARGTRFPRAVSGL